MKHLDVVTLIVTFDLNLKIRIHVNCSDLRYLAQFGFSLTGKKSMHYILDKEGYDTKLLIVISDGK